MTDTHDDADETPPQDTPAAETADKAPASRRKRRGTGPISMLEDRVVATSRLAAKPATPEKQTSAATPKFGRYERPDFERVETMLASFAQRRFGPLLNQVAQGWFGPASPEERQNPQLRTAFYSFFLYGYHDPQGVRIVDMFNEAGLPLEGRQKAALEACLSARLVLMAIEDIHPGKHRVRGRDMLRDEPVTVLERNLVQVAKPGERILSWQIPWGTSWKPIGVASQVLARKSVALDRALETLCNTLRCVRRELPTAHAANLWWLVHRVANM